VSGKGGRVVAFTILQAAALSRNCCQLAISRGGYGCRLLRTHGCRFSSRGLDGLVRAHGGSACGGSGPGRDSRQLCRQRGM